MSARSTATGGDMDGQPIDREQHAAALAVRIDPAGPAPGSLAHQLAVRPHQRRGT